MEQFIKIKFETLINKSINNTNFEIYGTYSGFISILNDINCIINYNTNNEKKI